MGIVYKVPSQTDNDIIEVFESVTRENKNRVFVLFIPFSIDFP